MLPKLKEPWTYIPKSHQSDSSSSKHRAHNTRINVLFLRLSLSAHAWLRAPPTRRQPTRFPSPDFLRQEWSGYFLLMRTGQESEFSHTELSWFPVIQFSSHGIFPGKECLSSYCFPEIKLFWRVQRANDPLSAGQKPPSTALLTHETAWRFDCTSSTSSNPHTW